MVEFDLSQSVLFEDDEIIVINKPQGLLSIEDGFQKDLPHLKIILQRVYTNIWVVHRLDKLTSGVIIFSKTENSHKILNTEFLLRKVKKQYLAITHGSPMWQSLHVCLPLSKNGDRHHRTIFSPDQGQKTTTNISVIDTDQKHSLICACPKTGYTHQIRAHLSMIGMPIIGDSLYKNIFNISTKRRESELENQQLFLHAWKIEICHPFSNKEMEFSAPIPEHFRRKINEFSLKMEC